ncbi:MAG: TonB-dependent receptor [Cyclobacteriaceae bacterium]|nr:TonB-dependent receptor plug domain-containing protein [Cyclobacteriaceae bacterium]MCB0500095.1 TonB-dependent receptor plug domain-containing protein [Cyclobacteriaceae bacterium]MCB9239303.1 TonB-dependent receptor plug domain-containing protein [Flammeovirgaceae bacterium]MCO5271383.1 TonB-dependent receptor [Cyclobacteriaceae bacterium]MCW5903821.1 TonB-dependent receptor plug domain-containing protein [Cyclobacteriaceae bacterium]
MNKIPFLLLAFAISCPAWAQNNFKAIIKDSESNEPLVGATAILQNTTLGATADVNGLVEINNTPNGRQVIEFRYIGYVPLKKSFQFPLASSTPLEVLLVADTEEMEEVVITATRSSRTIADLPTRVEAISGEELAEKGNMKPGDIRMLLNESTGIQTQQTSATSYNSSIRIQGLDGKYTQLLRDGMPLYSGFSGGLGLLQIVPLDLQQVEVIKGASSTLYGGGAIAGLVNLVSKTPSEDRELNFMLNGTSALGLDVSGFYSQKFEKVGTTIFASSNHGTPYDPANIGLTAIPKFDRFTLNPKLFVYLNGNTSFNVGLNTTMEKRTGGDLNYIEGKPTVANPYFEENTTARVSSQTGVDHKIDGHRKLSFRNSTSYYDRGIRIPSYEFSGVQWASFSELAYNKRGTKMEWIAGLNLWTDQFKQNNVAPAEAIDYNYNTVGVFVQNTWNASSLLTLETGMRGDYQNKYGFFALPRVSAMFKLHPKLTARAGGGLGYKAPTVFTEDAERIQFQNVLPINTATTEAEKSTGGNLDFNYKSPLSDNMTFNINTLFFYTRIDNPLILVPAGGYYEYQQPAGLIDTKGIETNVKLTYNDLKLFVGYTLADVNTHYNGNTSAFPLVAKHRLNNVLMYEVEGKLKIGLEGYYFSRQKLNDGAIGQSYWIFGLMTEKLWENFSLFLNFENFGDTRQTRFDTIFTGPVNNPTFRDIYAPVDGFVVNGGIKVKL